MYSKEKIGDIYSMFPDEFRKDIDVIINIIPNNEINMTSRFQEVFLGGKKINIFYRTYFLDKEIKEYCNLTDKQKLIFDCINTTQSNGYKREESLKKIIKTQEPFVSYFVLRLLGDFVTEIQNTIYENIEYLKTDTYKNFILENDIFFNLIKSRVNSYWAEYRYNDYPSKEVFYEPNHPTKKDYPGFIIINELDSL